MGTAEHIAALRERERREAFVDWVQAHYNEVWDQFLLEHPQYDDRSDR